jgi:hypothetical protein
MTRLRTRIPLLAAVLVAALIAAPVAAQAAPDDPFVLAGTFDGSATPDGSMETGGVVVNQVTGRVLVMDKANSAVIQFNESGIPVKFAALPTAKRPLLSEGDLFIDNSGTASQGNFYVVHPGVSVEGFAPSGEKLAAWPIAPNNLLGFLSTIGVDQGGDVWFAYLNGESSLLEERSSNGAVTGKRIESNLAVKPQEWMVAEMLVFDSHENVYAGCCDRNVIYRRDAATNYIPQRQMDEIAPRRLQIDPSTDDLWVAHDDSLAGTTYTQPFEKEPPFERLPGLKPTGFDFAGDGQTIFQSEGGKVNIFKRQPPKVPKVTAPLDFYGVKSRSTFIDAVVDTGGGAPATYTYEFATDAEFKATGKYTSSYPVPGADVPHTNFGLESFRGLLEGFQPLTDYHVRLAATNVSGTGYSADATLRTLPAGDSGATENCVNALARKQTGATGLPDCRAYELVSAPYTGGFDVESPMVPGQTPFAGYPSADGRVLYGVHAGVVPGPWKPTNRGVDPYVAVRGADGWATDYVGLPADLSPKKSAFSSILGGADADLHTFAFAGPGLCDPCFASSPETGIPLRRPDGELVQAMAGSNPIEVPNLKPEGRVAKMLSADGQHLVFGSQYPLVPGANNSGGNLNIFDRDLATGITQLVSTTPTGAAMQVGMDVSQVDISVDGSRILLATKVSVDAAGNEFGRLFMHIGSSPKSAELTTGFTQGVIFAGMTADGSKVFFTSREKLLPADADNAADLYEAEVDSGGDVDLALLTPSGGPACSPVANSAGAHWNTVDATADCSAVALGGGAGVASASGAVFFLSPELLSGGVANQPNLYEVVPGGSPELVATLSPDDPLVIGSTRDAEISASSEFQANPNGSFATLRSSVPLTGINNAGKPSVFVFTRGASVPLACASCNPSVTEDPTLQGEAALASAGLSITDDGRVFFNTQASLGVEDTGGTKDVYEWVGGRARTISSGIGRFDSELLSVTHDGTDAFFYTHDTLDANVDQNGERTKIYDARVGGGFFELPVKPQCQASDECHGPGTIAPGPPLIASSGRTSNGNIGAGKSKPCRKGKVRRRGKCVKKPKKSAKSLKKGKKRND